MKWREWEELPKGMQKPEVREYYEILSRRRFSLKVKRIFDVTVAAVMLVAFCPLLIILSVLIKLDSKGSVFYRQERVTAYGKKFRIHKLRTMVADADRIGTSVTVDGDSRITRVGFFLRKYRLDEVPQLIDVLKGDMSFVGARPEVPKYVEKYTDEMKATLLLPAGITSEASIRYKDEAELLNGAEDVDKVYVERVLPGKMKYNLERIKRFSFINDFAVMPRTVSVVFEKNYK